MNKPELIKFFKSWFDEAVKDLDGRKLTFPDDWPEDHPEKSADFFCEYFGIKDEE